jgi:hypothetical protein
MNEHGLLGCYPALFLAMLFGASPSLGDTVAFPGADGYGSTAIGWQGGDVVHVTNLDNEGAGSLRDCAENGGAPRVCIFDISGTIVVDRPIMAGSNLYIAGQTAPGDGIQIRIGGSEHTPLILHGVHDVVVRFLKLRPGPSLVPSPTVDALTVEDAERVFLGNLSLAFATDETFNIHVGTRAVDITLADSLLAFSLDRTNHPSGRHSKGALICSPESLRFPEHECGRISLLRNLFAHHRDRNPDLNATSIGPIEVINNVFYDPISQFGEIYDLAGDITLVYAGNVILPGPSTIRRTPEALQAFDWTDYAIEIAAWDNLLLSRAGCQSGRRAQLLDPTAEAASVTGIATTVAVIPPEDAFFSVLTRAGDTIPGRREHDVLDQRVINDVSNCTGQVISSVAEVGGWPEVVSLRGEPDRDGDGLPDQWEDRHAALDSGTSNDVWEIDPATGMSHLETWLAVLAGDI